MMVHLLYITVDKVRKSSIKPVFDNVQYSKMIAHGDWALYNVDNRFFQSCRTYYIFMEIGYFLKTIFSYTKCNFQDNSCDKGLFFNLSINHFF